MLRTQIISLAFRTSVGYITLQYRFVSDSAPEMIGRSASFTRARLRVLGGYPQREDAEEQLVCQSAVMTQAQVLDGAGCGDRR